MNKTAKSAKPAVEGRLGVTSDKLQQATGSTSNAFQSVVLQQVLNTLWRAEGASAETKMLEATAAYEALQKIAPQGELEGMLAAQMVATHNAAMECLRRSMLNNQTFEGRDQSLKHAVKLMSLYERQLAALDKHRGKGRQKITVEHVHVHPGGQAIVGDVHAGGSDAASDALSRAAAPRALTDESQADAIGRGVIDQLADAKPRAPRGGRR